MNFDAVSVVQSFWHPALVEKSVNFAKIRMVELFVSREIFPKQLFFLGDESIVLPDLLRILFDGYVDVFFDEIPVECFEVEIYLPHIFFREIVKSAHDVLLNL